MRYHPQKGKNVLKTLEPQKTFEHNSKTQTVAEDAQKEETREKKRSVIAVDGKSQVRVPQGRLTCFWWKFYEGFNRFAAAGYYLREANTASCRSVDWFAKVPMVARPCLPLFA